MNYLRILQIFLRIMRKNHENFRVNFRLSYPIKFFLNIIYILRFCCKNLTFPLALGGLRPPNPLIRKGRNYHLFSWGADPQILGKNKRCKRKIQGKFIKIGQRRGVSAPRTPWSDKIFNYSYIFVQLRPKNSCNFC